MKRVWRILRAPFRLVAWLGRRCLNLASKITGVEFAHGEMDGAGYEHYVAQYLYKNGYKKGHTDRKNWGYGGGSGGQKTRDFLRCPV